MKKYSNGLRFGPREWSMQFNGLLNKAAIQEDPPTVKTVGYSIKSPSLPLWTGLMVSPREIIPFAKRGHISIMNENTKMAVRNGSEGLLTYVA